MDNSQLTILITGGNGFLGSALVRELRNSHEILVLEKNIDNLLRLNDCKGEIEIIESNEENIQSLFSNTKIDLVIHTATLYGREKIPASEILFSNVYMPLQVAELGINNGIKAFINTDSFFNREQGYKYLGNYTLSKKHLNDWLQILSGKIPIINLKLQHMYGPYDNPDKFVMKVAKALQENIKSMDFTPGEQVRDFVYIQDVVNAFVAVINKIDSFHKGFHQFDVGSGNGVSVKQFIEKLKTIANSGTHLKFGALEYRENEIMNSTADISALRELGWQPNTSLESGIVEILKSV